MTTDETRDRETRLYSSERQVGLYAPDGISRSGKSLFSRATKILPWGEAGAGSTYRLLGIH